MEAELHHFSDASVEAYRESSYVRLVDVEGHVYCSLVIGKSRVALLQQITVPRLELAAGTILARMSAFLRQELSYANIKEYFWTAKRVFLEVSGVCGKSCSADPRSHRPEFLVLCKHRSQSGRSCFMWSYSSTAVARKYVTTWKRVPLEKIGTHCVRVVVQ